MGLLYFKVLGINYERHENFKKYYYLYEEIFNRFQHLFTFKVVLNENFSFDVTGYIKLPKIIME